MQPDTQHSVRNTIEHGPAKLRPELYSGSLVRVLAGLRAHANTISHARHVALEETFPRTRALLGEDVFHALSAQHIADPATVRRSHTQIGKRFWDLLDGAAYDLARLEWAWLQAYGAAEADAFDLEAIAGLKPETVAATPAMIHPATHLVPLATGGPIDWDGDRIDGRAILVTRPRARVIVTGVDPVVVDMFVQFERGTLVGDLLDDNADAATRLVTVGALALDKETIQ